MSIAELLETRERTHGTFTNNSDAFARLAKALPIEDFDERIQYAVAGIYIKLARLHSGKNAHREHIEDIAGYAAKMLEVADG